MTITYSLEIASATSFAIHKLLLRWKGSIWKSIWMELSTWMILYALLSLVYRFVMKPNQQRTFEDVCNFFYVYADYIPFTFMLGFYVNAVFNRWRDAFANLGWIDTPALQIATFVKGSDDMARKIRRTIIRYMVLTQTMVYRDISTNVNKRFPTMNHLVVSGMMTETELKEFDKVISPHWKYWLPFEWIFTLVRKARESTMIDNDITYSELLKEINQFRMCIGSLVLYDWIPIPLVYTQVANLAVRTYFIVALLGRQYLISDRDLPLKSSVDLYIPIMTIMQFLFYVGWLKVAEVMLNPFGEDDDDFESNYIIDRNLQVGLAIVDECYDRVPDLEKDAFWDDSLAEPLYTVESAARPQNPMTGSCAQGESDHSYALTPRKRIMSTNLIDEKLSDCEVPVYQYKKNSIGNESAHSTLSFHGALPNSINQWLYRNSSAPNIFNLYEPHRHYRINSPKRHSLSNEQNDISRPVRKNGIFNIDNPLQDAGLIMCPDNWISSDGLSTIHEEEMNKKYPSSNVSYDEKECEKILKERNI